MDGVNRRHNVFAYQRSNEITKEWCNKLMAIGIFLCLEKCTIISASVDRQGKAFLKPRYPNDRDKSMSLR